MRIVTWNCCRGSFEKNIALLDPYSPDIVVLQECARPKAESDTCLWFGDNPHQGIAVQSSGAFTIRALPTARSVPKFVIPIEVTGPVNFTMFAVWSKAGQKFRYVMGVVKAVRTYKSLFKASPCVLIGDVNSNRIWDHIHPPKLNHSALIALLDELGLVSSYHHFFEEAQGSETQPTFHLLKKRERPYHIDYCFVPAVWTPDIRSVQVGTYDAWTKHSDHQPLFVDLVQLTPS